MVGALKDDAGESDEVKNKKGSLENSGEKEKGKGRIALGNPRRLLEHSKRRRTQVPSPNVLDQKK